MGLGLDVFRRSPTGQDKRAESGRGRPGLTTPALCRASRSRCWCGMHACVAVALPCLLLPLSLLSLTGMYCTFVSWLLARCRCCCRCRCGILKNAPPLKFAPPLSLYPSHPPPSFSVSIHPHTALPPHLRLPIPPPIPLTVDDKNKKRFCLVSSVPNIPPP